MQFNSFSFLLFFPVAVGVYYLVPRRWRYIWLLICSYYFYMSWNPKYAVLIFTSTFVTYIGSIVLGRISGNIAEDSGETIKEGLENKILRRKLCLASCIAVNLAILFYFKYANFFFDKFAAIMRWLGLAMAQHRIDVLLPVGISFYTFQALSYLIDVYKGRIAPERNFFRYALFVSFFPQLVAGPIERSENLLPQLQAIDEKSRFDWRRAYSGLLLILWGIFLKMVIADRIAVLVNNVYERFYLYGSVELIMAAAGFSIQIYCDFCSYSTIAVGAARILGIDLMENFNTPYFATSIKDFWQRWHISLSTWFRDYFYIPLGGNRCSMARKNFNLLATFLVSGLWHGAGTHFVFWGGGYMDSPK